MRRLPPYRYVFLDADGTLFDFDRSEQVSLRQVFGEHGFPFDETVHARYQAINSQLWRAFERGEIDKKNLQHTRFERLLMESGLSADPCDLNERYLFLLSENVFLIEGAEEACCCLAADATLLLATNGVDWTQRRRLANSPLAPYFRYVVTSEEAGVQKPSAGFFDFALARCGNPERDQVLMVGDLLATDIRGAAEAGLSTCWYDPSGGPVPADAPRIDHVIRNLRDLEHLHPKGR